VNRVRQLISDFAGLARLLGLVPAFRWLAMVALKSAEIQKQGNLQPADLAMGDGPFLVRYSPHVQFHVKGRGVVTGIREMYVRDNYLRGGLLEINEGDRVLDLGANIGNFTTLALAHGKRTTVVAVEPSRTLSEQCAVSLSLNEGFTGRAERVRAFVGNMGKVQQEALTDPSYSDAEFWTEDQLLARAPLEQIDFLKCDIEGGEFALLSPSSRILKMTKKIAIEIHSFAGNVESLITTLAESGFQILHVERSSDGTATVLGKRV
jgi:FkbM family methyltransferase